MNAAHARRNEYSNDIPVNYGRLIDVGSIKALFAAAASAPDSANIILFRRPVDADFGGLARVMGGHFGLYTPLDAMADHFARTVPLDGRVRDALEVILQDIAILKRYLCPENSHFRKVSPDGYPDDQQVHFFHEDDVNWRFMCCYNAPVTEWLRNEDAVPVGAETQGGMKLQFYRKAEGAVPYRFQPGDMWLHSGTQRTGTPGFVHRAVINPGGTSRLLLAGTVPVHEKIFSGSAAAPQT